MRQLDFGIDDTFVSSVRKRPSFTFKPYKKRARRHIGNADKSPGKIICIEVPAYIAALDCVLHAGVNRFVGRAWQASNVLLFIAVRST